MKMNRWSSVFFLVLALGGFLSFQAHDVQAKAIQLSYADLFPPTHIQAIMSDTWAKEVEKRTNGKVKITMFHGGVLLKGPQIYDGVTKGIADMGMSVLGYSRGRFPAMEAIDLPMGYPSGKVATAVINAFYKLYKPKGLSDTKVLYLHAHGPGLLHSKKLVNKLEDLKGLKIRAYGFNAKVVSALGAVPVAMPQNQVYEALQKGVADATFSPMEVLKGFKQAEVIKYTILCDKIGYTAGFFVVMNLKKWNSLPKDVQKVFEEVSEEWIAKRGEAWDSSDEEGRKFTLSRGNELIPLSEEENLRWLDAVIPVIGVYENDAQKKGLPGKTYTNSIVNLIRILSK